jgi:hypothetical protein
VMTKDEAWNLIAELNNDAHAVTWKEWEAADGDDELCSEASVQQALCFRNFLSYHVGVKEACEFYAQLDESFRADWKAWYQPELDEE